LLHLVDGASGDPVEDHKTIIQELEAYGGDLADKNRVTVLNKIDALDDEERAFIKEELEAVTGVPVLMMSGVSREGVPEVLRALRDQIDEDRLRHRKAVEAEQGQEDAPWEP
jgi:GTP-binding protein